MNCSKCNSELKEGAKFCGKCGTPQVALPVDSTQAAVTQTSAPSNNPGQQNGGISKVKDKIFWNIQPGELARRFNESQLADKDNIASGIIINDGTSAFIKAGGEFIAEIHGGAYDFVPADKIKQATQGRIGGVAKEAANFVPLHQTLDDFRDEDTYNVKDETSSLYQKNPVYKSVKPRLGRMTICKETGERKIIHLDE